MGQTRTFEIKYQLVIHLDLFVTDSILRLTSEETVMNLPNTDE